MRWFRRYKILKRNFLKICWNPISDPSISPQYSSPPFPFWSRDEIHSLWTQIILLLPPAPNPSYKVRIGKGRYLRISDSLENDPHGEILTPHHEFKPRKSCCSCFNSPPTPHMRKKDREKSVEKNAYFDAYYSNKICVHLALFFTDLRCRKCFKKSSK